MIGRPALAWLGGLVMLASIAPVAAQPRRAAPPPVSASLPAPTPAPRSATKPTPIYDACFGPLVFLTSRSWRECCILCGDAGSDTPSDDEVAELKAATECTAAAPIVNQYFSVASKPRDDDDGDRDGDKQAKAPRATFARNEAGGYAGLASLKPRLGGFE